jgi:hypothetical protein
MPSQDALPPNLAPLGITREAAAAFVCVSPGKYDQMVQDGRMPPPKVIDGRKVWDVDEVKSYFKALPADKPRSEARREIVL